MSRNTRKYYGYSKEQLDKVLFLLDKISVKGFNQIDSFADATRILRQPKEINVVEKEEEGDSDGVQ